MRKKYVVNLSLAVLVMLLIIPKAIAYGEGKQNEKEMNDLEPYVNFYDEYGNKIEVSNNTKINDGKAYVNFYDEHGQLTNSYSQSQLIKLAVDTDVYKQSKENNSGEPFARFYDGNGVRLNPPAYIEKEMMELSEGNQHKLYVFHHSSFLQSIGIGQNRTFKKPRSIIVEPDGVFEAMSINLIDLQGEKVGRIEVGNFRGGIKIPLTNYVENEAYSILLVNGNQDKPIHLLGGIILYD